MKKYALILLMILIFPNNFLFPFDKETYEKSIKEKIPKYYQLGNGINLILISREIKSSPDYVQFNIPLNTDKHIDRLSLFTTGVLLKKMHEAGFRHKLTGKYCFDFFQDINFGSRIKSSETINTVESIIKILNSLDFDSVIDSDLISQINYSFDSKIPDPKKKQCNLHKEFFSTYFKDMIYTQELTVDLIQKTIKENVRKNNLYITVVSKLNASEIKDKISRMKLNLPSIQKNYFFNRYQNFKKKKSAVLMKKNSRKQMTILLKSNGVEEKKSFMQETLVLNVLKYLIKENNNVEQFKFTQNPFGMINIDIEFKTTIPNNGYTLFNQLQKKIYRLLEKASEENFLKLKFAIIDAYFSKRETYLGMYNMALIKSFYGESFVIDNIDKISRKNLMDTYSELFSVIPQKAF